jgi:CDP-paratose 2-epimerase
VPKLLISGICGFVGSCLAHALLDEDPELDLCGIDNLSRPGSPINVEPLCARGVKLLHADVRSTSDLDSIPSFEWVIDAAANPSVLGGLNGRVSSRQMLENNLYGTINLLELTRKFRGGFILLSTSRVYSVRELANLPTVVERASFHLDSSAVLPKGVTAAGITEQFSTTPPLSLYGTSKLASEIIALEYAEAFDMPVWINRCGVLAGAGQFGRPDQGIFAYWINGYLRRMPLHYIGFGGHGYQTRDCLHPCDLMPILRKQMAAGPGEQPRITNLGGGAANSMSLAQLSEWCAERFGRHNIQSDKTPRPFDIPWLVMDCSLAEQIWGWRPATKLECILDEIARHAQKHPEWLRLSAAFGC